MVNSLGIKKPIPEHIPYHELKIIHNGKPPSYTQVYTLKLPFWMTRLARLRYRSSSHHIS